MESPVEEEGKSLLWARDRSPSPWVHQAGRPGTPGDHPPDGSELHSGTLRGQLPGEKRVIGPEPGEKRVISPEAGSQNRLHKVSGGTDVFPDITSASYVRTLSGSSPTEIITSTVTEIIYLETRTTSPRPPAAITEAPVGTNTDVPVVSAETHGFSAESALASAETHVTSFENTVASCENTVASCENTVTSCESVVTSNATHVSSSESLMASSESTVASYVNKVASSERIVASSENTATSSESAVVSSERIAASSESTVAASENTVSRAETHRANTETIRMDTEAPVADTKTPETNQPRPASSLNTEAPAAGTEACVAATETRLVKNEVHSSKTETRSVSRETSSVVIETSSSPCVSMASTEATETSARASSGEVGIPSSNSEGPMASCRAPGINPGASSVSPKPPSAKPEVPAGKPKGTSTKDTAPAPSTSSSPRHEMFTFRTENASTITEGLSADIKGHSANVEGPSAITESPSASKESSASVVVSASAAALPAASPTTSSFATAPASSTATLAVIQPPAASATVHASPSGATEPLSSFVACPASSSAVTSPSPLGDTQAPSSIFLVTRASCASSTCSSTSIERKSGFATPLPTGTPLQQQRLLQESQGQQGAATEATRVVSVVSDSGGSSVDGSSSVDSVGVGDSGNLAHTDDEAGGGSDEIFVSFRRSVMENFRLSGYCSDDELDRGARPRTSDSGWAIGATPPATIQPGTSTTTNDMRGASAARTVVSKVANTSVTGIAETSSARGGTTTSMGRSSSWDEGLGGTATPIMLDGTKTWSGATSRRARPYQNTSEHFHSTRVIRCSGKTQSVTGYDAAFLAAGDGRDTAGLARGVDLEEPRKPRAPEATAPADAAAVAAGVDVAAKEEEAHVADGTAADGAGVAVDGVGGASAGADASVSSGDSSGCSSSTTAGLSTLANASATASASASVVAEALSCASTSISVGSSTSVSTAAGADTSVSVSSSTNVSPAAGADSPKLTSSVLPEQEALHAQESAPGAQGDEKKERASRRAAFLAAQDFYALSKTAKATQRTFKSRRGFASADGAEGAGRLTKETKACESSGQSTESGRRGGASSSLGRTLSTGDTKSDDESIGARGDGGVSPMITTQKEIASVVSSIVNKGTYLTLRTKRSASREGATSAESEDGATGASSPSERDSPVTTKKSEREWVVTGNGSPGTVRGSSWQVKRTMETTQGYAERIDETLLSLRGESRGTPSPGVLRRSEGYNLSPHTFRGGEFGTGSPMVCGSARGGSMSPLVYRRSAAGGNLSPLVSRRSDVFGSLKLEISRTEEKTTNAATAKAEEGTGASSKSGKTGVEEGSKETTGEGQGTEETGAEEEPPSELPAKGFVADKLSIFNAVAGGAGSPVVMRKSAQVKESSRAQVTREVTTTPSTRLGKEAESGRPRVAGPGWGAPASRPGTATGETGQAQRESQTTIRELVSGSGTVVKSGSAQVAVPEEETGTPVGGHRPDKKSELVEEVEEQAGRTASSAEGDASAESVTLINQSLHISSTQEEVATAPSATPTGDLEEEAAAASSPSRRPTQKDSPVSESRISGGTSVVSSSVSRVSSSTFTSQAQSYTSVRSLVTPRVATPKKEETEETSAAPSIVPAEAGKAPSAEITTGSPAEAEKAPSSDTSTSGPAGAEKAPSSGTSTSGPAEAGKAPSAETSAGSLAEAEKAPSADTSTRGPAEVRETLSAETSTGSPAEEEKAPSLGTSTSSPAEAGKAPSAGISTIGPAEAEKLLSAGTSPSDPAETGKTSSAETSTSGLAEAVKASSARISSSNVSYVSSVSHVSQVSSVSQVTTVSQVSSPTSAKKQDSAASISVSPPPPPLSPKPVRLPLSPVSPSSPPPPPVSPKPVKLPQAPVSPPLSPKSGRLSASSVGCVSPTFASRVSSTRSSSASFSSTVSISSLSSRSSPAERDLSEDEVTVISYRCATPNYPSNSEIRTDGSRSPLVSDSASDTERASDGGEEVIRAGLVADRRAIFSGACTPLQNTPRRRQLEGPPSAQEGPAAEGCRTSKGSSETRAIVKSRVIVRGPGTRVVLPAEGPGGSLSHSERPFSPAGRDTATSWSRQVIGPAEPHGSPSAGPRDTTGPTESRVTSSSGTAGLRTAVGSSESRVTAGKTESRLLGEARTESQVVGGRSATSQITREEAAKWQSALGGETGRESTAGTAEWQTTTVRSSKLSEERLNFFRRTTTEEVRGASSPRALPSRELDTPSTTTPGSSRDSSITTEEGEGEETRAARVRLSSSSTILSGSRTPVDKVTIYADPNISKTTTTIATQTEGGGGGGGGGVGVTGARGRASTSSSSVTDVTSTEVTYRRKFWSGKSSASSASSGSSKVAESLEGDAVTSSQDLRRDSHYLSVLFQDDDALEEALREFTEQYNLMKGEGSMSVERRGTKALELWARRATEGYPGVSVTNMTTSWRDGLAFCALIHHFRPDLIDFQGLKAEEALENNAQAFRIAEQQLGIPALLDAEDMVEASVPDRLSILTYVSQFYQTFAAQGLITSPSRRAAAADTHPSKPAPPPASQPRTLAKQDAKTDKVLCSSRGSRELCVMCNGAVYLAQRLLVGSPGLLMHRTCFKCARCNSQLNLASYYETEKGQYCCETCPDEENTAAATRLKNATNDSTDDTATSQQLQPHHKIDPDTDSEDSASEDEDEEEESCEDRDEGDVCSKNTQRIIEEQMPKEPAEDAVPIVPKPRSIFLAKTLLEQETSQVTSNNYTPKSLNRIPDSNLNKVSSALFGPTAVPTKQSTTEKSSSHTDSLTDTDTSTKLSGPTTCHVTKATISCPPEIPAALDTGQGTRDPDGKHQKEEPYRIEEEGVKFSRVSAVVNKFNRLAKDKDTDKEEDTAEMARIKARDTVEMIINGKEDLYPYVDSDEERRKSPQENVQLHKNSLPSIMLSTAKEGLEEPAVDNISPQEEEGKGEKKEDEEEEEDSKEYSPFRDDDEEPDESGVSVSQSQTGSDGGEVTVDITTASKDSGASVADDVQYPDELNPFGDDDDDEEEEEEDEEEEEIVTKPEEPKEKKLIKAPLNPFESDEEDSKEEESEMPSMAIKKSLNPFWSDDEEPEEDLSLTPSKSKPRPPRPPPPTLSRNSTPATAAKSVHDYQTKQKQPPPKPPHPKELIPTPSPSGSPQKVSPQGTPNSTHGGSAAGTVRLKKKIRPAPVPPGCGTSPQLGRASPTSTCDTASITTDSASICSLGAESLPSRPATQQDEVLSCKLQKERNNRNKMNSQDSGSSTPHQGVATKTNKSETGEWRRKKGPAPLRPVPQKRNIKKLPMRAIQTELHDIEVQQTGLERQGVLLERAIRERTEDKNNEMDNSSSGPNSIEVEDMILQLFELVNEKNELFRRQTELMYLKREKRLEEEYAELEYQIRCLMLKSPKERSEDDSTHEEELIARLVKVVEQRDEIINCLELDRLREAQEDESIATQMMKYQEKHIDGIESAADGTLEKPKKKKALKMPKKKKKEKVKKDKKGEKVDADKDVDEVEAKEKKKKKKWFLSPKPN